MIDFHYLCRHGLAKIMLICCCPPGMGLNVKFESYALLFVFIIKKN